MYYYTRQVNKINGVFTGVMSTKDGEEDFLTEGELAKIQFMGVKVLPHEAVDKFVGFVNSFFVNANEFGSSEFDMILNEIVAVAKCGKKSFRPGVGGSNYDYVKSLLDEYIEISRFGIDLDLYKMWDTGYDRLVDEIRAYHYSNYNTTNRENFSRRLVQYWGVSEDTVKYI